MIEKNYTFKEPLPNKIRFIYRSREMLKTQLPAAVIYVYGCLHDSDKWLEV